MTDPGTDDPDLSDAIQSATYNAFSTDKYGDVLVTVPFTHEKVHEGIAFNATHEFTSIADASSITTVISVPSTINAAHLRVKRWTPSNERIRVEIFRSPTIDTNGSAVDATINMNDGEGSPEVSVTQGATTTSDGTLMKIQGSSGTKDAADINTGADEEIIFQPSTDYLIRVTNISANNNAIDHLWFSMFWYEV